MIAGLEDAKSIRETDRSGYVIIENFFPKVAPTQDLLERHPDFACEPQPAGEGPSWVPPMWLSGLTLVASASKSHRGEFVPTIMIPRSSRPRGKHV